MVSPPKRPVRPRAHASLVRLNRRSDALSRGDAAAIAAAVTRLLGSGGAAANVQALSLPELLLWLGIGRDMREASGHAHERHACAALLAQGWTPGRRKERGKNRRVYLRPAADVAVVGGVSDVQLSDPRSIPERTDAAAHRSVMVGCRRILAAEVKPM